MEVTPAANLIYQIDITIESTDAGAIYALLPDLMKLIKGAGLEYEISPLLSCVPVPEPVVSIYDGVGA